MWTLPCIGDFLVDPWFYTEIPLIEKSLITIFYTKSAVFFLFIFDTLYMLFVTVVIC